MGSPVTKRFESTVGTLAYDDIGAGDPIVLLHATLHDRRDFAPVVQALAQHNRVLALDWPAHGESANPGEVSAMLLADVLEEFVTGLDLRRAVFIGNSVGGYAAARLAIHRPDRVAALVLVNTGGFIPPSPAVRVFCAVMATRGVARLVLPGFIRGYMKSSGADDDAIIARAIAMARTPAGLSTFAALWRSFTDTNFDLRDRGAQITAPTLIVWGSRDIAIPRRVGRHTHAAIPQSTLHELPTGHVVFSSAPAEFLDIVQPFIASVARPRTPGTNA